MEWRRDDTEINNNGATSTADLTGKFVERPIVVLHSLRGGEDWQLGGVLVDEARKGSAVARDSGE